MRPGPLSSLLFLALSGCTASTAAFEPVDWQGEQEVADGAIWFDGSGEAWFRTSLECGSEVYVWYSTDEGTNGTLDLHVLDATGATVLEATFGDENHEATLHGHPGLWRLAVHSRPGFAGNGIAYLECD